MTQRYAWLLLAALIVVPAGLVQAGEDQKPKQKKGWLGVSIQTVTERIQKREKLPSDEGAYIADVVDDSPADSAGLKRGDVIVSFGGKAVYEPDDLSRFVSRTAPGTKSEVVYYRDGDKKTLNVVVGSERRSGHMNLGYAMPAIPRIEVFMGGAMLGATVKTLNKQLAEYFAVPNSEGVLVEEVEKDKAGAKAGLQAGDVIIRFGKRTVDNVDDITKELRTAEEGEKLELEVWRKGTKKVLTIQIPENEFEPSGHMEERIFRMHPGEAVWDWNDEDGENSLLKLRRELSRVRERTPALPPVALPHVSRSRTI